LTDTQISQVAELFSGEFWDLRPSKWPSKCNAYRYRYRYCTVARFTL